ncbi:MAG: HAD family hydrolase [Candidatus Methanomethylicia archaeon]
MFKVVFVDFWKTLIAPIVDEQEYFRFRAKCLNDVLRDFGYSFDMDKTLLAHTSSRRICDNIRESFFIEIPLNLELRIFLSLLNIFNREPEFMDRLRTAYMLPLFNLTSPIKGANKFLEDLKSYGFKIGLISNVYIDLEVIEVLKIYDLYDFLDSLTLSCIVGFRKPRPEIFKCALNSLSSDPSKSIMVGDDYNTDIIGALNLGMKAIWFTNDSSINYPFKTNSLENVLDIILKIS